MDDESRFVFGMGVITGFVAMIILLLIVAFIRGRYAI